MDSAAASAAQQRQKAWIAPGLFFSATTLFQSRRFDRAVSSTRIEHHRPPRGDRRVHRLEAPAARGVERFAVENRAGVERSTRDEVTEPSVPTVISTSTSPAVPARSASGDNAGPAC